MGAMQPAHWIALLVVLVVVVALVAGVAWLVAFVWKRVPGPKPKPEIPPTP